MSKKSLWEFHRRSWYNAAGIPFEDIKPHIENIERVDKILPPSPRCYLVTNVHTYRYEYVGKGQSLLTGYDNEHVSREGVQFQLSTIHPQDAEYIIKEAYAHFEKIIHATPLEERKNLLMQNNYRLRHKEGHYVHMMEQLWVMKADEKGDPQLMLIHVYELPMVHPFSVNTLVKKLLPDQTYEIVYSHEYPGVKKDVSLSPRETEVTALLAEGYTSEQIAERLSISYHTVSTHRKNILQKLEVKSTNELIAYGITRGIIK